MRKLSVIGLSALFCIGVSTVVYAEDFQKFEVSAYARAGLQVGKNGLNGERIDATGGFAPYTRLLEGQYFELGLKNSVNRDNHLMLTLAMGGDSFHYNNDWTSPGIALRNLYFEMGKIPADSRWSAWFGSRMYRGDDMYLYDYWPLDAQNLLGGGVAFNGENQTVEFAAGVKKENAYSVASDATTLDFSSQRFIFINKITFPLTDGRKIKTVAEFNMVPSATATFNTTRITTPSVPGVMVGGQYMYLPGHSAFLTYGYGAVSEANGLATQAVPVLTVAKVDGGTMDTGGALYSQKGSQDLRLALGGSQEVLTYNSGMLYGLIARMNKPSGLNVTGTSISAAIRPMHYLSDHVHVGAEFDGVAYGQTLSANDVSYLQVAPMIEYAMNKNAYGTPKFRLIASNVFYSKPVTHFDASSKYAFTVSTGFEVWF
jgi:hypothetical protein